MAEQKRAASGTQDRTKRAPSAKDTAGGRKQTLNQSAMLGSIADAIVIKDESLFFLSHPDGSVPMSGTHGFGLYYHDCRFLDGYEMQIADTKLDLLVASAAKGYRCVIELTNPEIKLRDGTNVPKETIGITFERIIDDARLTLRDVVTLHNFGQTAVDLPITISVQSHFDALFAVRAMRTKPIGKLHQPIWKGDVLETAYDGKDGVRRVLTARFDPSPATKDCNSAHLNIKLEPRERQQVRVALAVSETAAATASKTTTTEPGPDVGDIARRLCASADEWMREHATVTSDNQLLDREIDRSLRDLRMLRSKLDGHEYFAAGVPWFVTLFGRDSIIASLQTLAFETGMAEQTLRLLARYQGTKVDDWRDEAPGKIMHEIRVGEMAHLNEIPQTPYYGSIDATPLFLILLARQCAWTGDLALFNDLRDNAERALSWMAKCGGKKELAGYLAYESKSDMGLGNQGWKDSGDAIVNADGSLAEQPIALAEVQGYMYMAKREIAELFRRAGDGDRADALCREADELRARFNRDFWMEDKGIYALALQCGGKPADVAASNAGQVLWSGIADADKAARTAERLMQDDMFSGWGVRTLSTQAARYNPIGYHLGTVWPHDNSLIAAGFRRYGREDASCRILTGMLEATVHFHNERLPEVFAGFSADDYGVPVHYPNACHPQAWAAGSLPYLLDTCLGLQADAFARRLTIARSMLPGFTTWLELKRLRVGKANVDLCFRRVGTGVSVEVTRLDGELDVRVERTTATSSPKAAGT